MFQNNSLSFSLQPKFNYLYSFHHFPFFAHVIEVSWSTYITRYSIQFSISIPLIDSSTLAFNLVNGSPFRPRIHHHHHLVTHYQMISTILLPCVKINALVLNIPLLVYLTVVFIFPIVPFPFQCLRIHYPLHMTKFFTTLVEHKLWILSTRLFYIMVHGT